MKSISEIDKDLNLIELISAIGKEMGARVIIHGGYAVDGALGRITRPHNDIDVQIYCRQSDGLEFMRNLLQRIAKRDSLFANYLIKEKKQTDFYRNLYVKIAGRIVDVYFLHTKNNPFVHKKILVKKDGTLTESHAYDTKYFTLNHIKFEAQNPVTEILDKIIKRENGKHPLRKRHEQDIKNLKEIIPAKALARGIIMEAIKILKAGGVVVYPTDTAYGLAADATNVEAVKKLYRLKGRDFRKPIHVIVPDMAWLNKIVKLNKPALKLMNKFLPGPLTLVLPLKAKGESFRLLSAGTKSLGIRLPKHDLCIQLVKNLGRPITTTSANLSGKPTAYSVAAVQKQFPNAGLFYLDGGKLKKTKPSTVVLLTGQHAKILRQGPISETQIKRVLS